MKTSAIFILLSATAIGLSPAEPLESWRDEAARQAIVDFVERVTREGGPDYVSPPGRVAVFDNDGTLWAEQPVYFQLIYAIDRIKALAPEPPEWKTKEPFASLLKAGYRYARPARQIRWQEKGNYWIQWTLQKPGTAVLWAYDPDVREAVEVLRVREK